MSRRSNYNNQRGPVRLVTAGFEEAIDELFNVAGTAFQRGAVEDALMSAAIPVRDKIKENIAAGGHIRTGRLDISIGIGRVIGLRKSGYRIKVGAIGNTAPHAHLVEFGHGGSSPAPEHPFMVPAYEATKDQALRIIAERMRAALFEAGGNYNPMGFEP